MLTENQESALTSAGDCFEHWHSSDRIMDYAAHQQLVTMETSAILGAGTFTIDRDIDYVVVDSSLGNVTLTIPSAVYNLSITVVKTSALNTVTVNSISGNINGAVSYVLSAAYSSAKFKAINGNYYKVA